MTPKKKQPKEDLNLIYLDPWRLVLRGLDDWVHGHKLFVSLRPPKADSWFKKVQPRRRQVARRREAGQGYSMMRQRGYLERTTQRFWNLATRFRFCATPLKTRTTCRPSLSPRRKTSAPDSGDSAMRLRSISKRFRTLTRSHGSRPRQKK
jgi:hypothetical protein